KTCWNHSIPPSLTPSGTVAPAPAAPVQALPVATTNQQTPRNRSRVRSVVLDHAVDDVVLLRLVRAHEVVTLGVFGDLLEVLARVVGDDLVEPAADVDDLFGV